MKRRVFLRAGLWAGADASAAQFTGGMPAFSAVIQGQEGSQVALPHPRNAEDRSVLGWEGGNLVNVDPAKFINTAGVATADQGAKADMALLRQLGPPAIAGERAGLTYRIVFDEADASKLGGYWGQNVYGRVSFEARFNNKNAPVTTPDASPAFTTLCYAESGGAAINVVANMMIALATEDDSKLFAFNAIVTGAEGVNNVVYVGGEIDIQPTGTPAPGTAGLYFNAFNSDRCGNAIQINGIYGGLFGNGIVVYNVAAGGTALAGGAGGVLPSLTNTGATKYTDDAHIVSNGHNIRFAGTGGYFCQLGMENGSQTMVLRLAQTGAFVVKSSNNAKNFWTIDASGNVAIGSRAQTTNGYKLEVATDISNEGAGIAQFKATNGKVAAGIFAATGQDGHSADCGMRVRANSITGRGLNVGGNINSKGSDIAERERKREDCGDIDKGQIIGFDEDGLITDLFSKAVSGFAVKSTEPNLVGGDFDYGVGDAPAYPVFIAPEYVGAPSPGPVPEAVDRPPYDVDSRARKKTNDYNRTIDESFAASSKTANEKFLLAKRQYEIDFAAHEIKLEEAHRRFEAVDVSNFKVANEKWQRAMNNARAPYDRIAYCGKVPINIYGARPGQHVIPIKTPGDRIGAMLVNDSDITFQQYRLSIGRVRRILDDGRAEIAVKTG